MNVHSTLLAAGLVASLVAMPMQALSQEAPSLEDHLQDLSDLNMPHMGGPHFYGYTAALSSTFLLQGTGLDGKPLTVQWEWASQPAIGPGHATYQSIPVNKTMNVYDAYEQDSVLRVIRAPDSQIPGNSSAPAPLHTGQHKVPPTSVLVQNIVPVEACSGTNEPTLSAYNEYNYAVAWCPDASPPSTGKWAKKNYYYLLGNGDVVLVMTLAFQCGTSDVNSMPSQVQSYCG